MTFVVVALLAAIALCFAARSRLLLAGFLAVGLLASTASAQINGTILRPLTVEQWHGWEGLGGVTGGGPECLATQVNRIDCFVRISGALIVRKQWDGTTWNGPTLISGVAMDSFFDSRPECVTWGADHIDCFVRRDSDKQLFRRTIHGAYMSGWEALGGNLTSDPECVTTAPERITCLARNTSGALASISFDGNVWSGWTANGGQILEGTRPSCVVFRAQINCAVVGTDNVLRHFRFTSTGVEQRNMQGGAVVQPGPGVNSSPKCYVALGGAPDSWTDDSIVCFAARQTNFGRWIWNDQGSNPSWALSDMGGTVNGDWDCVVRSADRTDCVDLVLQNSGFNGPANQATLRHRVLETGQGVRIANVPLQGAGGIPTFVRCMSWASDRLDCFASGTPFLPSPLLHAFLVVEQPVLNRAPRRPLR